LNCPENPRPFYITNGEEVVIGIGVGYNTDRILYVEIEIERVPLTEVSRVANNVSIVRTFNNIIDPYARILFY